MPGPGIFADIWGIGKSVGEEAVHAVKSNESVTKNALFNEIKSSFLRRKGNLKTGVLGEAEARANSEVAQGVTDWRAATDDAGRAAIEDRMAGAQADLDRIAEGRMSGAQSAYVNARAGLGAAKDFYWGNHDGWTRAKRIGGTVLGANAVMGTAHHITGNGGYFHDSNGDFDIAGIPFF